MREPNGTVWANAVRTPSRNAKDAPGWFDSEIEWFANYRDGEMGLSGMPLEPNSAGGDRNSDGISDRQVKAATLSRRIEAALAELSHDDRLLLLAAHTRLSTYAHKDKHDAQARCIRDHEGEIVAAVAVFRRAWAREGR